MFVTTFNRMIERFPVFTLLTGISLAIGLIVPTVFEWTEKEAARSRHPEMELAALVTILGSLAIALILWFLDKPASQASDANLESKTSPIQFGIRHVMIATTLVAITLAAAPIFDFPESVLHWIMVAVLIAILVWTFFQTASVRSRMGATLACLFLPFAWIVPYNEPFGHTSGLLPALLFGPGILPAAFLRGHLDDAVWVAVLFVILELSVGIWLARRGGKLALAYTLFILCLSTLTSLGFHALYRM